MDILQLGAQMLSQSLDGQVDNEAAGSALSSLLGDGQGNIDLAGLASKMASSGELRNILNSWLGDGANEGISAERILSLLGDAQVAEFAGKVGMETDSAARSLSDVLPQLVDKSSSGGSLLEAAGGIGGLMDAARSFLKT